jgi:hypothetical protein
MLSTLIRWTSTVDLEREVRLDIGRVQGAAVADYKAILVDEPSGELATAEVKQYPRWSEPVAGLVARALHYCVSGGTPSHLIAVHPVRTLQVKIALVPGGRGERRELVAATADFRQMRAPVMCADQERGGSWETREVRVGSEDPLRLTVQCLSQCVWDAPMPCGAPQPLAVPIRRAGKTPYIRMADIPEPARSIFRSRIRGSTVPVVAGESGGIAYAWDWEGFLDGTR